MIHVGVKVDPQYPLEEWGLPKIATEGAACFDVRALTFRLLESSQEYISNFGWETDFGWETEVCDSRTFGTGLYIELPKDHVMLVFSRSGHGYKHNIRLANCVGVVDSDYRGELYAKLVNDGNKPMKVCKGDRIAQCMILPLPKYELILKQELEETKRGEGGCGSTGVK
jgi:dUTP pyrophosphatase